uniref:Uncharacterized protein n=1 Tax=Coccidioides posadasii RMSCC 3488 TaxID=454284 RepID=A0A0J6FL16_COCPO|nr:hypothetical protein CPAG_06417 [Coccidioides posadasii RMSCC 3488]
MDVSALQVVSMVFGSLITLLLMHREAAWMGSRNRRPEILLILVSDVFGSPARTGMGDLINMQSVFLGAVPQSFIIMKEQNLTRGVCVASYPWLVGWGFDCGLLRQEQDASPGSGDIKQHVGRSGSP